MDAKKLKMILADNERWVNGEEGGKQANLRKADLRKANLRKANLWKANLRKADLRKANLRGAALWKANLQGAALREANLQGADLWEANLRGADLREANLDFSCWPLWCGTKGVILDNDQKDQLKLHLYWVLDDDDPVKAMIKEAAQRAADKRNIEL